MDAHAQLTCIEIVIFIKIYRLGAAGILVGRTILSLVVFMTGTRVGCTEFREWSFMYCKEAERLISRNNLQHKESRT